MGSYQLIGININNKECVTGLQFYVVRSALNQSAARKMRGNGPVWRKSLPIQLFVTS